MPPGQVALAVTSINGVLARLFVSGLDAAIPSCQELADAADLNYGAFRDAGLPQAGPFLLLAGNTAYRNQVAMISVERLGPVIAAMENAGGQIIERPSTASDGARLIACHRAGPETSPSSSMTKSTTNSRQRWTYSIAAAGAGLFNAIAGCVLGAGARPVFYAGAVHLGLITVVVSEYDPAIRFFVDRLGFELVEDSPALTNDGRPKRWVVVRPPGAATGLLLARADGEGQAAAIGQQAAGRVGFFLQVEDFDAAYTQMASAGVEFLTAPRIEPYGHVAVFADIAGNKWDLIGPVV